MQIIDIVLYNSEGEIRQLSFKTGAMNIVTGASKTGKSSIIEIVEYVLGREQFTVPAGIIRDTVKWYGLRLQFENEQVFIARPPPPTGRTTGSEVYLDVAVNVEIPPMDSLRAVTNPTDLNQYLTQLLNISGNLNEPPEGQTRRALEATLRHTLYYVFQQQDEIANRKFLFHRQADAFMPQAIKDTLPYFLGAIQEDRLAKQQELRRARRELAAAEKRLKESELVRGEGATKGISLAREAQFVGLIESGTLPTQFEELTRLLQSALVWRPAELPPTFSDTLTQLQGERSVLQRLYRIAQNQIREAQTLADEQSGFSSEVNHQRARLQTISLYGTAHEGSHSCPVCQSSLTDVTPNVSDLEQALEKLNEQLNGVSRDRPKLRTFIDEQAAEIDDLRRQLQSNREAIDALLAQDADVEAERELEATRSRVAGRLSLYLESLPSTENQTSLEDAVKNAQTTFDGISEELRDEIVADLLSSILNILAQKMTEWARVLKLEHSEFPLRLDISRLNVVADTDQGPIPLDQMGSGENWVGYHLIAHLALHQWFIQKKRPVPRFLFLDQPTQVYYPPDHDVNEGSLEALENDDRFAVTRMFQWLFAEVAAVSPDLQVILIDHADIDEPWFQDAVVERWRGGNALIPAGWRR